MQITEYFSKQLLTGQVAVITGGGSGINFGVAKALAELGARIALCGRTEAKLLRAKSELEAMGARVYCATADVRDAARMQAFFGEVKEALGDASIVVCGAAGNFLAPAAQLSPNGFKTVIDIDLIGSFNSATAALAQLRATRGKLVFISAGQSYTPYAFQVHAGAAKAGIDQMMRNLALEWGRHGIRVNSVVPGPIEDTQGLMRLANPADLELFKRSIPLARLGTAADIGAMVAFLCSPLAAYVTGARLDCDGGQNLAGSGLLNHSIQRMLKSTAA